MKRFVEGLDRGQSTLFPASLDNYVSEDNRERAVCTENLNAGVVVVKST